MANNAISPDQKLADIHSEHDRDDDLKKPATGEHDATGKIFSVDDTSLPKGYFTSQYFLGSMLAIGLSVMCGVAGFSFIAPLLSFVNADIGPSDDLTWVALTYTLTGAVGLMIVGRLTGMFRVL